MIKLRKEKGSPRSLKLLTEFTRPRKTLRAVFCDVGER